jgi:hypothetical protein
MKRPRGDSHVGVAPSFESLLTLTILSSPVAAQSSTFAENWRSASQSRKGRRTRDREAHWHEHPQG